MPLVFRFLRVSFFPGCNHPRDFFLLVANDNDFITQHGFQTGAPYADASGVDLDTMLFVYRVTLPEAPQ